MFKSYFTPRLKWIEPKEFESLRDAFLSQPQRWFIRIFLFFLGFSGIFLAWGVSFLNPNKIHWSLMETFVRAFVFACVLSFLMPWLASFGNSTVYFYKNKIARSGHGTHPSWKYTEIADWRIDQLDFKGQSLPALVLRLHKGRSVILGLNKSVNHKQIAQAFSEQNIPEQLS